MRKRLSRVRRNEPLDPRDTSCVPLPFSCSCSSPSLLDFHWPALKLVVETDGLRYHRTPAEQTTDRLRDQAHVAAGLTPLRFTHAQVRFEPGHVRATLAAVARGLEAELPR